VTQRKLQPTPTPGPGFVALRGQDGTLYGFLDPTRRIIEFKRHGRKPEQIDLAHYLDKTAQKA
jgi:hypothetical protein